MRELRPYQLEGLEALRQSIKQGVKRIVLQLPTGGGKTLLSASIAQGVISKGKRMAFTVPRIVLVDQTIEEYAKEGIYDVGAIQARHHMTDWGKPIQVCSIDSIRTKSVFPEAQVVIFDEIHLLSETHVRWMDENPNTIFIGLSATPWRRGLGKHFESLLIVSTMKELMELGYLCKYKAFGVDAPDLKGIRKTAGDYNQEQLSERLRGNKVLTADIINTWKTRWGQDRTLCFAVDLAHAKVLQERFIECGVNAGYQDARTPADERRALKRSFHDGSMPVLVSVGTLITGVDYDVRAISWCRPTQSEMLFVQAFGRGMRLAPPGADPKDHLLFLDHAGTISDGRGGGLGYPEDIIYDELDNGEKKTPEELEALEERKPSAPRPCPKCAMLIPKGLRVCPGCLFECKVSSEIHEEDGELVDLTRGALKKPSKGREYSMQEKGQFLSELKGYATEKGYRDGWAAMQYRTKFKGTWPEWSIKHIAPQSPSATTRSWIRSRMIAFAKAKRGKESAIQA